MSANIFLVVCPILLCLAHLSVAINRPSSIKFENNQYTGLVVGIHPDIPEDPAVIAELQRVITDASAYLYTATKKRAFFEDVTIVLPETWSDSDLYESPGNATYEYSDVIVAPANPRFVPIPYTKHFEACGKQAAYIHFTEAFLMQEDIELFFGPLGRLFVHEWGHFRWGLLNEYADTVADRSSYQYHYRSSTTGLYEATRCCRGLNGVHLKLVNGRYVYCNGNPTTGYEDGCVFIPVTDQDPAAISGSVMFGYTSIPEVVDFCDNDTDEVTNLHNVEAPNKLNRICGTRSSWEIMREHADFRDGNNPARDVEDLVPTFHITRALSRRIVVVMDTSVSMLNDDRHHKQASAIAHYFSSVVLEGSSVGLVSFSTEARVDSQMEAVAPDGDARGALEAAIRQDEPSGGTCIQCGLETALQLISDTGVSDGAVILLITDGDETVGDLQLAEESIIAAGVVIDAIAFSEDADSKLASLAGQTGGTLYLQTDDVGSSGLYQGLSGTMKRGVRESEQRIELESTTRFLDVDTAFSGQATVDTTIGDRTSFYFSWNKDTGNTLISVNVTSPTGAVFQYREDPSFRYVIFDIPGTADVGTWSYEVANLHDGPLEVAVNVASYPKQDGEEPITVESYLSSSTSTPGEELIAFAEVRQGYSPVIDANVVAVIERPPDSDGNVYAPVELPLLDNGAGADLTEDDGIYSRYFTEYSSTGFYGVKIRVDSNNGAATILRETSFEGAQIVIDADDLENFEIPVIGGVEARIPGMPPPVLTGDPAPEFSREGSGQSAAVPVLREGYDPNVDSTPPGAILDLIVTYTSHAEGTVTLQWTAPGDDLDRGKASRYEIRRAETLQELRDDFESGHLITQDDVTSGTALSDPHEFGVREEVTSSVPGRETDSFSYAFAIKSFDDMDLASDISNIVVATFENYVIPTSGPIVVTPEPPRLEPWAIALIVAASGVCLVALFILFAVTRKRRTNKKQEQQSHNLETESNNPTYTHHE